MRTISKRTQYGLKAMQEAIPIRFPELILLDLKGHGLLNSKKGPHGGYRLERAPSKITIGSFIRIMEGPLAPLPCASETAYKPCAECIDVESCGTRIIMRQVRDATARRCWTERRLPTYCV